MCLRGEIGMQLQGLWFSEICTECGSAFSIKSVGKLHEEKTPYQHIEVFETEQFGNLMVIDGFVMLSEREHFFYHEMMTHPVLFRHPKPVKVAIVGGGDCGSLHEVLKHDSVREAWLVEIDERVTRVAEDFFPELTQSNRDARAHFHFGDGIAWMADCPDDSFDIIIVDSTDPIGPAEGLFKAPFYRECLRVLGREGILIQQSESPLYHLDLMASMRKEMRAAGADFVKTIFFPQCVYPSGW